MKTVIIGGSSSIGKFLKPVLSELGEVLTAGRKNCDIHLDLSDPIEKISLPLNLDTVIQTAANFGGKTAKEMLGAMEVNVLGTLKLCQAAYQANAKHFVLISSIYACLGEDAEQYSIYALSKKHAEEVAKFFCSTHSLPLTILRPSPIYGIGESFRAHQPFLYMMMDKAEKAQDITLYGSNDPLRNYNYIDDLINIIVKVVEKKVVGTYSCTQTTDITHSQIAKAAFKAFNSKASICFLKNKPDIPDNIFEKDDSLYKMIGYYPKTSMEQGIKKIALSKAVSI